MSFEHARKVADAVLYEGYVLYPYRASSRKNRFRFQFGVLAPRAFRDAGGCEECASVTEVALDAGAGARVRGKVRFLQLRQRTVERLEDGAFREVESLDAGGALHVAWDEAVEREIDFVVEQGARSSRRFEAPAETTEELVRVGGETIGRVVRRTFAIEAELRVSCDAHEPPFSKIRIEVENVTAHHDPTLERDRALRVSLLGAHVLLFAEEGAFVSLLDPPEAARAIAAGCENVRAFPVLVGPEGDRSTVLSSPIVLYDWPSIAPESQGEFFDALEIDEMLTLRTMTLTDAEKREARATDARAAAIVERVDAISGDGLSSLHGAIRSLRVGRASVGKGSRVRIRIGARRTDAQDMFLDGRVATVEDVREDFEGNGWIGVIVDDDPAAELHRWYGRHLWFHPDELEILEVAQ